DQGARSPTEGDLETLIAEGVAKALRKRAAAQREKADLAPVLSPEARKALTIANDWDAFASELQQEAAR
ncbi:MAG TPA: hypothetical protein VKS78_04260, partial [Roseiarcus sp.]|nr:hypothetical protein [Roseiarcus sp.]